jgi:hypothetical protein
VAAGECLTAPSLTVGAAVVLGTCNQATAKGNVLWTLISDDGSTFELWTVPGSFVGDSCVGASNSSGGNNTRLVIVSCVTGTSNQFRLG